MTKEQEDAIVAAYMGICVLSTMCDKAGLHLGRERSNELLKELSEAFPEAYHRALLAGMRDSEPDATPAGALVAETSGATAGEMATNLRLCRYCKAWHSKPCGEGCCWSPDGLSHIHEGRQDV